jgi:hypothetical protein
MVSHWQSNSSSTNNGNSGFSASTPTIRGRAIFCQLSNHRELTSKASSQAENSTHSFNAQNGNSNSAGLSMQEQSQQSPVLRVVIDNLLYPGKNEKVKQKEKEKEEKKLLKSILSFSSSISLY